MDGRVRIRDTRFEKAGWAGNLLETLRKAKGILDVNVNEISGSILICYDPNTTNLDEIKGLIPSSLYAEEESRHNDGDGKVVDLAIWKKKNAGRITAGRLTKGGMLSSLAVSLLFGLMGRKDLHILTGLVFLGFLQLHLVKHGKRLFS
jgi:hypothetical protein